MLDKKLISIWNLGKFAPAWIISTHDPEGALMSITDFVEKIMEVPNLPINNNPDYLTIRRLPNSSGENLTKFITVDQIRDLQKFFSTTNSLSPYKIAVIHEADTMNINAANCCLKILEDTPDNGFIFLVTSHAGLILPTIKSRCAIIQDSVHDENFDQVSYCNSLELFENNKTYFEKISGKIDKEEFLKFGYNLLFFLNRLVKNQDLNEAEKSCSRILRSNKPLQFLNKFEKVKVIVDGAINHDLDFRANFILIFETIKN